MDIATIVILFLLGLWSIKHHYDNKWEIEQLKLEYNTFVKVTKKAAQQTLDEFERTRHYQSDMKKMQSDLTEFRQSLDNIDGKYRLKTNRHKYQLNNHSEHLKAIIELLNLYKENRSLKNKIVDKALKNRTTKEQQAMNKLFNVIIDSGNGGKS